MIASVLGNVLHNGELSFLFLELPGPEEVTVVASEGLGLNVTWKPSMDSQWVQPKEYVVEWRKEIADSTGELLNWTRTLGSSTSALLRGEMDNLTCSNDINYVNNKIGGNVVHTLFLFVCGCGCLFHYH